MQEVFEKIIEKVSNLGWVFADYYPDGTNISRVSKKSVPYDEVVEIVKQEAEQYYKEKYFNLDNSTLHKCPKCGADAEHRVNKKGSWACGCFKCNLFKTSYDHGKAIQGWEDFCSDNNGWISCDVRLPEIRQDCLVTVRYTGFLGMHGFWVKTGHMESENDWWGDCAGGEVIAWQPLPSPFKEKE